MNFWKQDNGVAAIRPEDIRLSRGVKDGAISGTIRTVMILGHYADVNIQCGETVIKAFMPRADCAAYGVGDQVSVEFGRHKIFALGED
jgi:putative spermidine/putrescine transport system ATP-binding protein